MNSKKREFIEALVDFLVGHQASDSVHLQLGNPYAQRWKQLRSASGIMGWETKEEARAALIKLLQ